MRRDAATRVKNRRHPLLMAPDDMDGRRMA
jgi:hypothetical protein